MINPNEARQRFDRFNKKALMVLTTALRAPLMLMMGCGYVDFGGRRHELHDYLDQQRVTLGLYSSELYNEAKHGPVIDFIKSGERVPILQDSKEGKAPIHRHDGAQIFGPYRYRYE